MIVTKAQKALLQKYRDNRKAYDAMLRDRFHDPLALREVEKANFTLWRDCRAAGIEGDLDAIDVK